MRSMLLSTALVFTALFCSGCASLNCDKTCGVDAVSCCDGGCDSSSDCCQGKKRGGLLGRLRNACQDCNCNATGNNCGSKNCADCQTGNPGGMGMAGNGGSVVDNGRIGSGRAGLFGRMGGGRMSAAGAGGGMGAGMGAGMAGGRIGAGLPGRGALAGRMGACSRCGLMGGACMCFGNHAPYTPEFQGPHGPETGHYRYPYYTTRAPRDFLMSNPPSIGR